MTATLSQFQRTLRRNRSLLPWEGDSDTGVPIRPPAGWSRWASAKTILSVAKVRIAHLNIRLNGERQFGRLPEAKAHQCAKDSETRHGWRDFSLSVSCRVGFYEARCSHPVIPGERDGRQIRGWDRLRRSRWREAHHGLLPG